MADDLTLAPVLKVGDARVRLGTCSWTDPTLVKGTDWYPKRTMSATDRLAFYASSFPVVEVDSTYYHPPSKDLAERWAERTPAGFTMDVKAYALLTGHPARRDSLWEDLRDEVAEEHRGKRNVYLTHLPEDAQAEVWRRFTEALEPLRDAGRLGAVLFQYPAWFTPRRDNRAALARLRDDLGDLRASVELRSPRWWTEDERERTLGLLGEHDLAAVVVDAPAASGLPTVVASTSDLTVVRFHGRNDETWDAKGLTPAKRFRYLYERDELAGWVPRVEALAAEADEVHLLMNNCYEDYGVRGAADLRDLLLDAGASTLEA